MEELLGGNRLNGKARGESGAVLIHEEVLASCALMLIRILSHAAKNHQHHHQGPDKIIAKPNIKSGPAESVPDESADFGSDHKSAAGLESVSDAEKINRDEKNTVSGKSAEVDNNFPGEKSASDKKSAQTDRGGGSTTTAEASCHNRSRRPTADTNSSNGRRSSTDANVNGNGVTIPDQIIAAVGCCLSFVAQEIDLAAGPRGAMESVLSLLLPPAGLRVREQAALILGVIAGHGRRLSSEFEAASSGFQARSATVVAAAGRGGGNTIGDNTGGEGGGAIGASDGVRGEGFGIIGGGQGERLTLWRRFCAGIVGGTGAQVSCEMLQRTHMKHATA